MHARALFRLTFANPVSVVYLGVVGASVVFEAAVATFGDPGFVGVWPFLLTAPASLLFAMVGMEVGGPADVSYWFLAGGVVVSALVQAFVLGALTETVRGRLRRTATR
ncbi:SCO4225 family membrane protein [Streptomyces sp. NPDC001665]